MDNTCTRIVSCMYMLTVGRRHTHTQTQSINLMIITRAPCYVHVCTLHRVTFLLCPEMMLAMFCCFAVADLDAPTCSSYIIYEGAGWCVPAPDPVDVSAVLARQLLPHTHQLRHSAHLTRQIRSSIYLSIFLLIYLCVC